MPATITDGSAVERRRIALEGAVQGVGFRPFVYRLAHAMGLAGWVRNTPAGVALEVQGRCAELDRFLDRLQREKPVLASIAEIAVTPVNPLPHPVGDFAILPSNQGECSVAMLPDVAACAACVRELLDPANRRYGYPFTSCAVCGPRFSIIEALPFDREHTTMRQFPLCPACLAEFNDPADRRFHAQVISCPACGPQLVLLDHVGHTLAERARALQEAVRALDDGRIVAVKGVGGYQLMVDAARGDAIDRLRRRKRREAKPFALLVPTLAAAQGLCVVTPEDQALLESPAAPIVLLRRRGPPAGGPAVAEAVAPDNPNLGIMLPNTPLQHLLMAELRRPVIATSGNRSEDPICITEAEALQRLGAIADVFLAHDRPIVRHADDSVARVMMGRPMVLRRARGYAPLPIRTGAPLPPLLAVGGHLKNAVALTLGNRIVASQHIGDLDNPEAFEAFQRVVGDFERLYAQAPLELVRDLHPDYRSTRYAEQRQAGSEGVQHHVAHVLACLADNELDVPCLGVSWDGTGYGCDGTIWGGEWFRVRERTVARVASLRPFRLPGGERAVAEPRRSAFGLLHAVYGDEAVIRGDLPSLQTFAEPDRRVLAGMLSRGVNSPWSSSAGRLFDAIAALLNLCQVSRFEGQAAMAVEFAAYTVGPQPGYPLPLRAEAPAEGGAPVLRADWRDLVLALVADIRRGRPAGEMAAAFQQSLVDLIVALAQRIGEPHVALSGGCFQNRWLIESAIAALRAAGFQPLWPARVPPNDGGLAVGQAFAAARRYRMA